MNTGYKETEWSSKEGRLFYPFALFESGLSPSTDERIRKLRLMHSTEYYRALKNKETMWLNTQDIVPGEISQPQARCGSTYARCLG